MEAIINTQMLLLAREARGLSQNELATAIGMSATNYSKVERGEINLADASLQLVAAETGFPTSFFYQAGQIVVENLLYRKRQIVAQKLITPIHAQANIIRLQVQQLVSQLSLPTYQPAMHLLPPQATATALAIECRKALAAGTATIQNLTQLIENWGIPSACLDFGTARIDSRSITMSDKRPIIIINKNLPGCRQRFSLAYELGYLLLTNGSYTGGMDDLSHQANVFAAALLMPEELVKPDFEKGITIASLAQLKTKHKVSMIALLYRADDLGYLTPNQKRYVLQQFNSLKIRRREPNELEIPPEQPQLIKQWIAAIKSKYALGTIEVAALLSMDVSEFIDWYQP
jgi:Zn-dependent peptidase ImmA (M78 family)/transcriptional regulator